MVAKYKHEETQKNICDATLKYKLDAMLEQFKSSNPNPEGNHQKEEGEK